MGDLRYLRGWEESLRDQVGRVGGRGERKSGGGKELVPLRAAGGGEGFPRLEGPTHSEGISREGKRLSADQRGMQPVSPLHLAQVSLLGSQA